MAVVKGVFVSNRQVGKLALIPEGHELGAVLACKGRKRGGKVSHMSGSQKFVPPHL